MEEPSKDGGFPKILKWIGYMTAILSFLGTLYGLGRYVYDRAETSRKIDALLSSESVQLQSRDFAAAWQTLEQAAQLKPDANRVRGAREALAMKWLEDVHLHEGQKFSEVTQKLEPVLSAAVATAPPGTYRADLRAHLGWIYFLQTRDGRYDLDPAGAYALAVADDAHNPFAQAMWGHWILWQNCDKLAEAASHFNEGLAANREADFVRHFQISALLNCHSEDAEREVIRAANAMRAGPNTLSAWTIDHIFAIYYFRLAHPNAETSRFVAAVPPAEHVATFHWLFDRLELDESKSTLRTYYLAVLEEAAGQREEALAHYRLAIAKDKRNTSILWDSATAAIKRLSH
jgi:tetratricopeptide (TPR) repeat protein